MLSAPNTGQYLFEEWKNGIMVSENLTPLAAASKLSLKRFSLRVRGSTWLASDTYCRPEITPDTPLFDQTKGQFHLPRRIKSTHLLFSGLARNFHRRSPNSFMATANAVSSHSPKSASTSHFFDANVKTNGSVEHMVNS